MTGGRLARILFTGAVLSAAPVFASQPAIVWIAERELSAVEVTGLPAATLEALARTPRPPAEWAELLLVEVASREQPGAGRIAGEWSVRDGRLRYEARFPWMEGVKYRADFRPKDGPPIVSFYEKQPRGGAEPTKVAAVYPSADELPENQLKFYVQFSGPMRRGDIYRHIFLRNARGEKIDLAFLELDEELWDPALTRITLLIDPGRIKRGVKPLVDVGPVFEEGKRYTLVVEDELRDIFGRKLAATFRKEFTVGPVDRTAPDPKRWKVEAPRPGSQAPLVVRFDEPMDHALALRMIAVNAPDGTPVAGTAKLSDQERRWEFTPAKNWTRGGHRIVIATTIEDLAGNNIGKLFDVDVFENVERQLSTERAVVPFVVR